MLNYPYDLYAYLLLAFKHIPMPEVLFGIPLAKLYEPDFDAFAVLRAPRLHEDDEPDTVMGPCHPNRQDPVADMLRDTVNERNQLYSSRPVTEEQHDIARRP